MSLLLLIPVLVLAYVLVVGGLMSLIGRLLARRSADSRPVAADERAVQAILYPHHTPRGPGGAQTPRGPTNSR